METMEKHKVLVIDDSLTNREILKEILKDEAEVIEFDNGHDAVNYLMDHFYELDIVLLDLVMPEMNGFEVLQFMKNKHMIDYLPVIMISADDEEKNVEYAFDLGAIDFITRPFMERIVLRRVLTTISLFEKQKELVGQIDRQFKADDQKVDDLTGLDYKQSFYNKVYTHLRNHGQDSLWMVAIDIDHFKLFNNFYGWEKGDQYLKFLGRYLKEFTRRHGGIAGYLGGDDFAVLCPKNRSVLDDMKQKIEHDLKNDKAFGIGFGPKFGFYEIENPTESVEKIYNKAVIALSTISGDYSRHIAWYDPVMAGQLQTEYELLSDIRRGVEHEEFFPFLQPKVNMETGEIVGAEALARWYHKAKGVMPPGTFVPALEQTGFISSVDKLIWKSTVNWMKEMQDKGIQFPPISVNVSRADFYAVSVSEYMSNLCDERNLAHDLLQIEITESSYIEDFIMIEEEVENLHKAGFKVLMDDFGSGYSSLNALKNMSVDILKIDMKFLDIKDDNTTKGIGILEGVLNMAKVLNLPTVVEGVETEEQADFLMDCGCTVAQGYHYYHPMPCEEFETLLVKK
ncbi:MAG: EAL domain-containing protein [Lachnospiraceae bacterium]|nr:EAL domain-containing protein [Lachnospiraceae bacterium]